MLTCLLTSAPAKGQQGMPTRPEGVLTLARLEEDKLRAETAQIEADTKNSIGVRGFFTAFAAPLTGLAAIAAIGVSLIGLQRDRQRQREQIADASRRQLDERLADVLLGLGSESEAIQAGAAVSLLTFLSKENQRFHQQVRWVTLANLKVPHSVAVQALLVRTFENAMRTAGPLSPGELDFSHALLDGASLEGLALDQTLLNGARLRGAKLSGASLVAARGRSTQLGDANLTGADTSLLNAQLYELQAPKANFGGADLNNAHMKKADLRGAFFRGTRLQAAHLEGSRLQGARFEGANVADTYFLDAEFDQSSLQSLIRAENWSKAHLSPVDEMKLIELASSQAKD